MDIFTTGLCAKGSSEFLYYNFDICKNICKMVLDKNVIFPGNSQHFSVEFIKMMINVLKQVILK